MRKATWILIVIGIIVVAFGWWQSRRQPDIAPPPPSADNTTLRHLVAGDIVGFRGNFGARTWLGIPYAAPPVGDRRWRAPEPPAAWEGVLETLAVRNMCPQFTSLLSGAREDVAAGSLAGDEDCLYLNVYAPPNARDLPVMIWLHGGGNSIGHGGSYDGSRLAVEQQVVVVTINYRLGIFGWFGHPALQRNNPLDDSGNYGTLDVIRALEWTRDNIGRFGGDPRRVTLFGESAGAQDTLAMVASPLAAGLFHGAIVQSGGYDPAPLSFALDYAAAGGHPNSGRELVNQLLIHDGTAPDTERATAYQDDMSRDAVREYLYGKTAEDLFAVLDGGGFGMVNLPMLRQDGHVLPIGDSDTVFGDDARHNQVPVVLGTNRDEPALFMVRDPYWVKNWLGFLPRLRDEARYLRAVRYGALAWKARGVDDIARVMTASGNPAVYAYRFDWDEGPSLLGYDLSVALGAAHGLEIPFVFGIWEGGLNLGYLYEDSPDKDVLARAMMSYWANFAHTGNPGRGRGGDLPTWHAWAETGDRMLLLDTPNPGIRMSDEEVDAADIIEAIASDPEIADQRERCELYVTSFRWNGFDPAVYEGLGPEGCGAWPPETFQRF